MQKETPVCSYCTSNTYVTRHTVVLHVTPLITEFWHAISHTGATLCKFYVFRVRTSGHNRLTIAVIFRLIGLSLVSADQNEKQPVLITGWSTGATLGKLYILMVSYKIYCINSITCKVGEETICKWSSCMCCLFLTAAETVFCLLCTCEWKPFHSLFHKCTVNTSNMKPTLPKYWLILSHFKKHSDLFEIPRHNLGKHFY